MLQNAYFLAKIGADTAENEQHLAEILPENKQLPYDLNIMTFAQFGNLLNQIWLKSVKSWQHLGYCFPIFFYCI